MPNIKGKFSGRDDETALLYYGQTPEGCFSAEPSSKHLISTVGKTGATLMDVGFNANKSNPIYKDNAKVTTRNFTYKIWTRIF